VPKRAFRPADFDGLHQQQQVVGPVAGEHRVGLRRGDLRDVGCEVLHLVDVVQRLLDHLVAARRRVVDDGLLHVLAPGVVLVDRIDLGAQRIGLLHRAHQRLGAHLRIAAEAEVVEVALLAGELQRFGADVEVDHFLAGIAQVVLAHVLGDLPADGRRGALHDQLHAVGGGGLELVGRARGAALVVVLQQLHGLAVPAARGVDLVDGIAHGRAIGLARRGLRARERFEHADLDRRGRCRRCGAAKKAHRGNEGEGECVELVH
jgi:hypothetical protein